MADVTRSLRLHAAGGAVPAARGDGGASPTKGGTTFDMTGTAGGDGHREGQWPGSFPLHY